MKHTTKILKYEKYTIDDSLFEYKEIWRKSRLKKKGLRKHYDKGWLFVNCEHWDSVERISSNERDLWRYTFKRLSMYSLRIAHEQEKRRIEKNA